MKKIVALSLFVFLFIGLCMPAFAQQITIKKQEILLIQDLKGFLQDLVDWVQKKPKGAGDYSIGFVIATNQRSELVTYTAGSLYYKVVAGKGVFSGEGTRYFSDRLWAFPNPGGLSIPQNPFDPNKTEKVAVSVDAASGEITITNSKNQKTVVKPEFAHNLLYGFGNGGVMHVISFNKLFLPIIK